MSQEQPINATETELLRLRQPSLGRLLLKTNRFFSNSALTRLRQYGYLNLSLAHTTLLPFLSLDGSRITTLTEKTGLTKQSVSQLVIELEQHGYLERIPDPKDRRAILVRFTDSGWRLCQTAFKVTQEVEEEFEHILGTQNLALLKDLLESVLGQI